MFISFAPPKEMNQRKGGRKRQPPPVCPPAAQSLKGATKQGAVRAFSGLPPRNHKVKLLITIIKYIIVLLLVEQEILLLILQFISKSIRKSYKLLFAGKNQIKKPSLFLLTAFFLFVLNLLFKPTPKPS